MRGGAVSTNTAASEAAIDTLAEGGTAVDAALAGFFALAGHVPSALLSPIVIVVAGGGSGIRFVEGRARQAGQGAPKPIRFGAEQGVPAAARVAASGSVAAVAAACTRFGSMTLLQTASRGVQVARKAGASKRAALLRRVGQAGPLALQERAFFDELLNVAPRIDGGLVTEQDLSSIVPELRTCDEPERRGKAAVHLPPWGRDEGLAGVVEAGRDALLVADGRGGLAGVVVERPADVLPMLEGEVDLPLLSHPVRKGVPRVKPATALPMAMPLAVVDEGGVPVLVTASTRRALGHEEALGLIGDAASQVFAAESAGRVSDHLLVARRSR